MVGMVTDQTTQIETDMDTGSRGIILAHTGTTEDIGGRTGKLVLLCPLY